MSIHSRVIIFTVSTGIRYGNVDIFIAGSTLTFCLRYKLCSKCPRTVAGRTRQTVPHTETCWRVGLVQVKLPELQERVREGGSKGRAWLEARIDGEGMDCFQQTRDSEPRQKRSKKMAVQRMNSGKTTRQGRVKKRDLGIYVIHIKG